MFGKIKTTTTPPPPNYPTQFFSSNPYNHHNPHSHSILRLLKSPRKPTSFLCNHSSISISISNEESSHKREELKFIRGEKQLKELSSWRIGGSCNYFIQVFDQTQLLSALRFCCEHSIRFMIIGKGSNCLFDDLGFDGCIILDRIEFFERTESGVYRVGSGFRFNHLGLKCTNEGFTGLEFAGGIPGTVGGATYMNAGADGQETADAIDTIEIITIDGKLKVMKRSELSFGYRYSPFQDMDDLGAIVAIGISKKETIGKLGEVIILKRRVTQPVGERTAGSVFCNPCKLGVSAGELIERAGLKGTQVGGAMVSNKHANFFINCGCSTSRDMLELIGLVKEIVYNKFGVELKEEILYIDRHGKL